MNNRMRLGLMAGLLLVLMAAGWVSSALAITWGEVDVDNLYPNVGAFMVELDDGRVLAFCSGTLIHERVFLTAAHCTSYVEELMVPGGRVTDVFVSFDVNVNPGESYTLREVEQVITHPQYSDFSDPSNPYDVGALVLAEPVTGIDPAVLPYAGYLDDLKKAKVLRPGGADTAEFLVAGYGGILDWYQVKPEITYDDQRRYAWSEYVALVPAQLHMNQNQLHDNAGTCFGDSGGPAFWDEDGTLVLVGITSWGDAMCVVTGFDYRVDIPETLGFIDGVIAGLGD